MVCKQVAFLWIFSSFLRAGFQLFKSTKNSSIARLNLTTLHILQRVFSIMVIKRYRNMTWALLLSVWKNIIFWRMILYVLNLNTGHRRSWYFLTLDGDMSLWNLSYFRLRNKWFYTIFILYLYMILFYFIKKC